MTQAGERRGDQLQRLVDQLATSGEIHARKRLRRLYTTGSLTWREVMSVWQRLRRRPGLNYGAWQ